MLTRRRQLIKDAQAAVQAPSNGQPHLVAALQPHDSTIHHSKRTHHQGPEGQHTASVGQSQAFVPPAPQHDPDRAITFASTGKQKRSRNQSHTASAEVASAAVAAAEEASVDAESMEAVLAAVHASRMRDDALARELASAPDSSASAAQEPSNQPVPPGEAAVAAKRTGGADSASRSAKGKRQKRTSDPSAAQAQQRKAAVSSTDVTAAKLAPGQLAGNANAPFMPADRHRAVFGGKGRATFAELGLLQVCTRMQPTWS